MNVCVVVATGVNAEGQREILGMDVGASEDGAFWLVRSLTARGLSGVELVTSDAHQGLKNAIAAVFAGASWSAAAPTSWPTCSPECPSVPNLAWPPRPSRMVRTIYQQLSPAEVHGQLDRLWNNSGSIAVSCCAAGPAPPPVVGCVLRPGSVAAARCRRELVRSGGPAVRCRRGPVRRPG